MIFTIYHNPNWSKSRQSLELLRNQKAVVNIVEYIKTPPSVSELKEIAQKLGLDAKNFLRKSDKKYKELHLDDFSGADEEIFSLMSDNPTIIETPIITAEKNTDKICLIITTYFKNTKN